MLKTLKTILEIQEYDMKMLRLMRLKKERQKELFNIESLREDLKKQLHEKEQEIKNLTLEINLYENKIAEIKDKLKKLEAKQSAVKKVEEFNALTQEITASERERMMTEQKASDFIDKRNLEEEVLTKIKKSLETMEERSNKLEEEIKSSIKMINEEGRELKEKRDSLTSNANADVFKIYEKLLKNKKDRVIVPIENRICSGCHIALTAQHENLVRKGERLVFCEHCSRILYWPESEESVTTTKRRRRSSTSQE